MNTLVQKRMLAPLFCLCLLAQTMAADTQMRITVPRTTHPPVLDGKLSAGEWDDAAAVTGIINQFDGVAHPRQATFWLKYDDTTLYVAQRSSLLPSEKNAPPVTLPWHFYWGNMAYDRLNVAEAMPPLYFKDNQNTVTIALAPNRLNSGDTPSWYRFMANISSTNLNRRELCEQIRGIKFNAISSSVDSLDVRKIPNTTVAANSFNADGTVWESEYAIPLDGMNVTHAPVDEEWGLLLARDYPQQDQNAIVKSESYRFDFVARNWRNLAPMSAYHIASNYARIRLTEHDPVVQVLDMGDLLDGRVKPSLALLNNAALPTTVTVKVTVDAKTHAKTIALAAGERKVWTSEEIAVTDTALHTLDLSVTNATGTVLYRQSLPFRAGYGRDRTAYVPDMWMSGEPKICGGMVCALGEYNPIRNMLWMKVKVAGRPGEEHRTGAEVSVRRQGEDKPFVTYPMSSPVKGAGDYELKTSLPELKPGVYEITACLYGDNDKSRDAGAAMMNAANLNPTPGPGRKLLARSRSLFIRYDHAKDLPWIGNKIGVTDQVLPPWTPIETKNSDQGLDLSCWGRTYSVDGSGLLTQVRNLDENILSGPVQLEIMCDGRPITLKPADRPTNVQTAKNEAQFDGSLSGEDWKVTAHGQLDYDGYLQYRLRLEPMGVQKVERIRLIVPLTESEGRYLHAAGSAQGNMRAMRTTMALKKDNGQLWNSGEQAGGPTANGFGLLVGNFKPYVWVGGAKRGIAFMADSDEGWVPDDTKTVSAIEVVRTKNSVNLVLNLVARPFTFDHAREITFSLQGTPLKPLPDNFRAERLRISPTSAFVAYNPDGWAWNGCQLQLNNEIYLGGQSSALYPLDWERNKAWNTTLAAKQWSWISHVVPMQYQALDAVFHTPEIDDPRVPGLQGANCYGYLLPEITANRDIYDGAMQQTEVEYRAWRYQQWIREARVPGWYFDNSFSGFGANPDAGMGYVIDLPDRPALHGQLQPGYSWRGMREILKRLRAITLAEGIDPIICLHATDTYVMGAYSVADSLLDGENEPRVGTDGVWFSEKWSPEYMQTLNDGLKWGLGTYMLDMFVPLEPMHLSAHTRATFRDHLGYLQLHDNGASTYAIYMDWRGIDVNRKADFLPYWDDQVAAALTTEAANVFASAWRQDNQLMVIVFNRNDTSQNHVTIAVDPAALGITGGNGFVVSDLQTKKADVDEAAWLVELNNPGVAALSSQNDGRLLHITLDIRQHDYRLLRIEIAKP
ncbi:MAG: hypothetical protein IT440_07370 [Phycisphaeraceae bacterium]|nr:hypothetical protein [Phycisphaeraceae bacterium]